MCVCEYTSIYILVYTIDTSAVFKDKKVDQETLMPMVELRDHMVIDDKFFHTKEMSLKIYSNQAY